MQKKWYIYVSDHHEGPFTFEEMKVKLDKKQIELSTYVWSDGMPDWIPIETVEDFFPKAVSETSEHVSTPPAKSNTETKHEAQHEAETTTKEVAEKSVSTEQESLQNENPKEHVSYVEPGDGEHLLVHAKEPTVKTEITKSLLTDINKKSSKSGSTKIKFDMHESIWVLLSKNIYSGPYTAQKLVEMLSKSEIQLSDKIWREGIEHSIELSSMNEITNALSELKKSKEQKELSSENAQNAKVLESLAENSKSKQSQGEGEEKTGKIGTINAPDASASHTGIDANSSETPQFIGAEEPEFAHESEIMTKKKRFKKPLIITAAVLIVLVASVAGLFVTENSFFFSLPLPTAIVKIPFIDGISSADLVTMRLLARKDPSQSPQVNVFQYTGDEVNPKFLAATNMPDGTMFDIELTGVPGTLINSISYHNIQKAESKNYLINIPRFDGIDGKPLPKGEYTIKAIVSKAQPQDIQVLLGGNTAIFQKKVFIGGKRDDNYRKKLGEYLASVDKQYQNELSESKQLLSNFDNLFQETDKNFEIISKLKKKERNLKWESFLAKSQTFITAIEESCMKYNPEVLKMMMNAELFSNLNDIIAELKLYRASLGAVIAEKPEEHVKAISHGRTIVEFQQSIGKLLQDYKAKIDSIEMNPPLPQIQGSSLSQGQGEVINSAPSVNEQTAATNGAAVNAPKELPKDTVKETNVIGESEGD